MRFLFTFCLLSLVAMANMDIYPKNECELFNNLRHTKNRGDEVLRLDRTYKMLKHHKGQYLIKVEGATPAQRWVDDDCLSLKPLRGTPIYKAMHNISVKSVVKEMLNPEDKSKKTNSNKVKKTEVFKQNLLALSWHNAFCETHRYKRECKRGLSSLIRSKSSEKSFVLHGLWPQPRNNLYCNVSSIDRYLDQNKKWYKLKDLKLNNHTKSALKSVMPGFDSGLHKHEWIKHGTCYGTSAEQYYTDAVNLVKQVNHSILGKFFTENIGKKVTLKELQILTDKSFGRGTGMRISLQCSRGLITEVWFYLGSGSDDMATLLKRGKPIQSRCKGGRIDKAGYSKKNTYRSDFGR